MRNGVLFLGRESIVDKDTQIIGFESVNTFKIQP